MKKEFRPYIYLTTNLITGKMYIGQHNGKQSWYLGSGSIFYKAFKKYGRKAFKKEILCYCGSEEELNEKEEYFIYFYNAVKSKRFYNLKPGGKFSTHSEETRKKISIAKKGKKFTEEHINNIRLSHFGFKPKKETIEKRAAKLRGKSRPKEVIDKIINTKKLRLNQGIKYKYGGPTAKLYCLRIEDQKIFEFLGYKDASNFTKLSVSGIQNSIKEQRRLENYIFSKENSIKNFNILLKNRKNTRYKVILQLDKNNNIINKSYSVKEANLKFGFSKTSIVRCLSGLRKTYRKFIWKYQEEVENV